MIPRVTFSPVTRNCKTSSVDTLQLNYVASEQQVHGSWWGVAETARESREDWPRILSQLFISNLIASPEALSVFAENVQMIGFL